MDNRSRSKQPLYHTLPSIFFKTPVHHNPLRTMPNTPIYHSHLSSLSLPRTPLTSPFPLPTPRSPHAGRPVAGQRRGQVVPGVPLAARGHQHDPRCAKALEERPARRLRVSCHQLQRLGAHLVHGHAGHELWVQWRAVVVGECGFFYEWGWASVHGGRWSQCCIFYEWEWVSVEEDRCCESFSFFLPLFFVNENGRGWSLL